MAKTDDQVLQDILALILDQHGWDLRAYRKGTLHRRLARRLMEVGCGSLADYYRLLQRNPQELSDLIPGLTIHYSYFFRDREVFEMLRTRVLPQILAISPRPRIWSAGCAAGEEIYSVAMLLADLMGERFHSEKPALIGSDLDSAILEKAREGRYGRGSLADLPQVYCDRFIEAGTGTVCREIRNCVRFLPHDLATGMGDIELTGANLAPFNLILLRNTLIYFERHLQAQALMKCLERLAPDGFLVLGQGEAPCGGAEQLLDVYDLDTRIYQVR